MANPYIGEIRLVGFTFAPVGWLNCDGSLQQISQYDTLYALIGTTYGGDGQSTFGLPDFRSRVPLYAGNGAGGTYNIGQLTGAETVTLNSTQVGSHNHPLVATTDSGHLPNPGGGYLASSGTLAVYAADTSAPTALDQRSILQNTGGQPHNNLMPYLCLRFIIATDGIFPPQS